MKNLPLLIIAALPETTSLISHFVKTPPTVAYKLHPTVCSSFIVRDELSLL